MYMIYRNSEGIVQLYAIYTRCSLSIPATSFIVLPYVCVCVCVGYWENTRHEIVSLFLFLVFAIQHSAGESFVFAVQKFTSLRFFISFKFMLYEQRVYIYTLCSLRGK